MTEKCYNVLFVNKFIIVIFWQIAVLYEEQTMSGCGVSGKKATLG